jgi:thiamine biosynthesis lipoprotein
MTDYQLSHQHQTTKIEFLAMANSCEVLVRTMDEKLCHQMAKLAVSETQRIESKFSRYRSGNLVEQMNYSHGQKIPIDEEAYKWLEYAKKLYQLSDGLFDITSGVLRTLWRFAPDAVPPNSTEIKKVLGNIGFNKIDYNQQYFSMPEEMQIDFGGIGKEIAVDQVSNLLKPLCERSKASYLVNFGGDLSAVKFRAEDPSWVIGLEHVEREGSSCSTIKLSQGAVATSGNTKRFFEFEGQRYGHLLNPKTGYPVLAPPRSITVFAEQCVVAGTFSSLAMLQGKKAEEFLTEQGVDHICIW